MSTCLFLLKASDVTTRKDGFQDLFFGSCCHLHPENLEEDSTHLTNIVSSRPAMACAPLKKGRVNVQVASPIFLI